MMKKKKQKTTKLMTEGTIREFREEERENLLMDLVLYGHENENDLTSILLQWGWDNLN